MPGVNQNREDSRSLEQIRSSVIRKESKFARAAMYNLSVVETRIIFYAILKSINDGTPFAPVTISISDFCSLCGIKSKNSYKALRDITDKLHLRTLKYFATDAAGVEKITTMSWVTRSEYIPKQGQITIAVNTDLREVFESKKYTKVEFAYLLKFTSRYSERLYSLLRAFEYKHTPDFQIEDLRARLGLEQTQYPNFADFRKRVLDPAINDINQYTDLSVEYRVRKGYKSKVTDIIFALEVQDVPRLAEQFDTGADETWTDENAEKLTRELLGDAHLVPLVAPDDEVTQMSMESSPPLLDMEVLEKSGHDL